MGNSAARYNIFTLTSLVRGDIIKVPQKDEDLYFLYSGDRSKLYPLNENLEEYFHYPLRLDNSRPTVTYNEAHGGSKCYKISEAQWIKETADANIDVLTYNKKVLQILLVADIIKIRCHYMMYIGNGKVIHLVTPKSNCSQMNDKHKEKMAEFPEADALITEDLFLDLAKNKKASKTNRRNMTGLPVDVVIKRAYAQKGEASFYWWSQNCWTFVDQMKYGYQVCKQYKNFALGRDASALVHESGYYASNEQQEIEEIPLEELN